MTAFAILLALAGLGGLAWLARAVARVMSALPRSNADFVWGTP